VRPPKVEEASHSRQLTNGELTQSLHDKWISFLKSGLRQWQGSKSVMCLYLSSTVEEPLLPTWLIYGNRLFSNSMAETLGAISSAFAVVSLALQLS
jgi:hypothetical protein